MAGIKAWKPGEVSVISPGNNTVLTFYLFQVAMWAGYATHKISVFLAVGFLLAFVLKLVNSACRKEGMVQTD